MAELPDFYRSEELNGIEVDVEFYRRGDSFSGNDYFELRYVFSEEVYSNLREFQKNESGQPKFYGAAPFIEDCGPKTEMRVWLPIGDHNHEKPIQEIERIADDLAALVGNYL